MENCPKGLKFAFLGISGRKEIHPCVLQDIGPLGPLPCSHLTSSADHSKQGIGYRWPCAILGWLVFSCGVFCCVEKSLITSRLALKSCSRLYSLFSRFAPLMAHNLLHSPISVLPLPNTFSLSFFLSFSRNISASLSASSYVLTSVGSSKISQMTHPVA